MTKGEQLAYSDESCLLSVAMDLATNDSFPYECEPSSCTQASGNNDDDKQCFWAEPNDVLSAAKQSFLRCRPFIQECDDISPPAREVKRDGDEREENLC